MMNKITKNLLIICFLGYTGIHGMSEQIPKKPQDPASIVATVSSILSANHNDHAKAVNALKELNIDLDVRGPNKETALHVCHAQNSTADDAYASNTEGFDERNVAMVLLKAGAKVTDAEGNGLKDGNGRTAFYLATKYNLLYDDEEKDAALCKLYLQKGAHPYETNNPLLENCIITSNILPLSAFDNMIMRKDVKSIALCLQRFGILYISQDNSPLLRASSLYWSNTGMLGNPIDEGADVCDLEIVKMLVGTIHFSIKDHQRV